MKNTKKFLSIIAVMLLTALIFSLGAFSASAQANMVEEDIYGTPVTDEMLRAFAECGLEDMYLNLDVEPISNRFTSSFIFVDEELLESNVFLTALVDKLIEENRVYTEYSDLNGKLATLAFYEIRIFAYRGNGVFEDLCVTAYNNLYDDYYTQYFDFTMDYYKDWLYSYVGNTYMCAFGVWVLPEGLENMLIELQDEWNDEMPVYIILGEPITSGIGGLVVKVFTWLGESYGFIDPFI